MTMGVIRVLVPEVVGAEPEGSKRLLRMVSSWGRLDDSEKERFRRHINGQLAIENAGELLPTVAVTKILHTSFYRVKELVKAGKLVPAKVLEYPNYYRQPNVSYRFERSEIERYQRANPRQGDKGTREVVTRRIGALFLRMKGLTFKGIGEAMGLSAGRARSLVNGGQLYYVWRKQIPVFHRLEGPGWTAWNCVLEEHVRYRSPEKCQKAGTVGWREVQVTCASSNLQLQKI